jgi:hypothetical protein
MIAGVGGWQNTDRSMRLIVLKQSIAFLNHSPFSSNHVSKFKSQNENPSHHMSRAPEQILGKAVKEGARLLFPIKRP